MPPYAEMTQIAGHPETGDTKLASSGIREVVRRVTIAYMRITIQGR
jgi:hypothetical protein